MEAKHASFFYYETLLDGKCITYKHETNHYFLTGIIDRSELIKNELDIFGLQEMFGTFFYFTEKDYLRRRHINELTNELKRALTT